MLPKIPNAEIHAGVVECAPASMIPWKQAVSLPTSFVNLVNLFLVLLQDTFSVYFLCCSGQALNVWWVGGSQFKTNPLLTFAAVHSSSAITTPSMISIPASPPDLPAACNSFKTMWFNFSLWTSSSRPLPCILLSAASFFSAGSAGTMIAMGLARSVAACTQMLATTVAER